MNICPLFSPCSASVGYCKPGGIPPPREDATVNCSVYSKRNNRQKIKLGLRLVEIWLYYLLIYSVLLIKNNKKYIFGAHPRLIISS